MGPVLFHTTSVCKFAKSIHKYFIEQTMLLSHLIANKIIFSSKQIQ